MRTLSPILLLLISTQLFLACKGDQESGAKSSEVVPPKSLAEQIVSKAVEKSGGENYLSAIIDFDFRDMHYRSSRDSGLFEYERIFTDSTGNKYRDVLNNEGFYREINGERVELQDTTAAKYMRSVNSVLYFATLPFGLEDSAVNTKLLGKDSIKGKQYYEVQVTFEQQGGGEDFQDVFVYWFNTENHSMDYMAYSYETDGGGVRFRDVIEEKEEGGIIFRDFNNYKPDSLAQETVPLNQYDSLYISGELELLSQIVNENIKVQN